MSVITGTVTGFEQKTSKKGNQYERIQIKGENGYQSWYTSFAGRFVENGWNIRCSLQQNKSGDGEFIDGIEVLDEPPAQEPPRSPQNGPSRGAKPDDDTWRKKDLTINTVAFYKALAAAGTDAEGTASLLGHCFKLACTLEKKVNAYVAGADLQGMKQSLQDDIEAQANEDLANQAAAESGDPSSPEHPAFDDDVPF